MKCLTIISWIRQPVPSDPSLGCQPLTHPDIWRYQVNIFFLFLLENIYCGDSLEMPCQGTSNEYPQHMFLWRNKKNINTFWMKKLPCQSLLTFTTLWVNSKNDKIMIFFLFFPENRLWYFMWIVSPGDNLHEILKPIFCKEIRKSLWRVPWWNFYPAYLALTHFSLETRKG